MELLNYFHDYMMMLLLLIMIFVSYLFAFCLFNTKTDKKTLDSHFLETVWTIIPMIILLFMAVPSLYLLYLMEEVATPVVTVKVVGHQWYWEYEYTDSWANLSFDSYMVHRTNGVLAYTLDVDNRLVLPTNVSILLLVTSADVIHAWTVPTLGVKTDAIPGRLNYLHVLNPYSGIFFGQCREICGSNHSFMPIAVEFVHVKDFINFVKSA